MLYKDVKPGDEIWFKQEVTDERGRVDHVGMPGTVQEIKNDNLVIQGLGDKAEAFDVRKYDCYNTKADMDFDLKFDRFGDKLMNKMMDVSEKYMGYVNKLMTAEKTLLLQKLPGSETALQAVQMRAKMLGAQFTEKVGNFADSFINGTQRQTLSNMNETERNLAFHTDLSTIDQGVMDKMNRGTNPVSFENPLMHVDAKGFARDGVSMLMQGNNEEIDPFIVGVNSLEPAGDKLSDLSGDKWERFEGFNLTAADLNFDLDGMKL